MKAVIAVLTVLAVSLPAYAGTAFLKGEVETGMTKQCFYDYLGSTITVTRKAYAICALTIEVDD